MAFEHKTYGKLAAWGIGVTPLPDDAVFVGSHQLSFNGVTYKQKDKRGATVGLRIWDVEIPFTTSGELVGGENDGVSLELGLGLVDSVTGTSWADAVRPTAAELDATVHKAYVTNYDTSASRDGVRSINASGEYLAF